MSEIILIRALFFVAMILLAAAIVTVIAVGSALVSRTRSMMKRRKKTKIARKRIPFTVSRKNRENPLPASSVITFDDSWLQRV